MELHLYYRPLPTIKEEIQTLLFPDASGLQFADACAQTVVFAHFFATAAEGAGALDRIRREEEPGAVTGGWVRYGDKKLAPILKPDFSSLVLAKCPR